LTDASVVAILTDANFDHEIGSAELWLVDFWAEWCTPCHELTAPLAELAREQAGRYRVGKLDVVEQPGIASRFGILSLPTLLIRRIAGARGKRQLLDELGRFVELDR
jgi:thioredoxin 1